MAVYNAAKARSSITGTTSNDRMNNSKYRSVTLVGGNGNDSIKNAGRSSSISGGTGNDSIWNTGYDVKIDAGDGNDRIYNTGDDVSILAGTGNDSIKNDEGYYATIDAGIGNDTIIDIDGYENVIYGGKGNDLISLTSYSEGININYNNGDGNDKIYGLSSDDLLNISGAVATSVKSGSNVILTVGSGKISLMGAAGKTLDIRQSFKSSEASSKIAGGVFKDSIDVNHQKVTVTSGAGNDTVNVNSSYASINAGNGNDIISVASAASNVTVGYVNGDGNDQIYGLDSNDVFSIGASSWSSLKSGSNVILTVGSNKVTLFGAAGKSVKLVSKDNVTSVKSSNSNVTTGTGSDSVYNSGFSKVKISTGAGNDSVYNYKGNSATIDGGTGNDTIFNGVWTIGSKAIYTSGTGGTSVSVNAGTGDDGVYNVGSYARIDAGEGKDTVRNASNYVSIDGGNGNDYINNNGLYSTIIGGTGNDHIVDYGSYVTIDAGAGNDSVYNASSNVSINAGTGNDSIFLTSTSSNVTLDYKNGDGNDKIYGMDSTDVFNITSGTWSSVKSGSDVILTIGSNKVTLFGAYGKSVQLVAVTSVKSSNSNVTTGTGNDSVYNSGFSKVKISTGAGNDSVYNYKGNLTTIDAGNGNDTILNGAWKFSPDFVYTSGTGGTSVSVNAGNGDDKIYDVGNYSRIDAGAGSDTVYTYASSNVYVNAGAGNDYINSNSTKSTILAGAGNDHIDYYGSYSTIDAGAGNDILHMFDASYSSIYAGTGNDLISLTANSKYATIGYKVGDGNDTIYGMDSNDVLSLSSDAWSSVRSGSNVVLTVGSNKVTLFGAYGKSVKIVAPVSNKKVTVASDYQNITTGAGKDSIYNPGYFYTKITSGAGNDSIVNHYGDEATIDAGNGNDTILNGEWTLASSTNYFNLGTAGTSVSINAGAGNDQIYNVGDYAKIYAGDGEDTVYTYASSNVYVDAGNGNDYINFKSTRSTINTGVGNDYIDYYGSYSTIDAGAGNDTIYSAGSYASINAGAGNDSILLTSNSSNTTISYKVGDGNDKIYGMDSDDVLSLSSGSWSSVKSGSNVILTVGSNEITLFGAAYTSIRILAPTTNQKVTITSSSQNVTTGGGNDSVYNYAYSNVKISTGDGNDSIHNDSGWYASIDAGSGNDYIYNYNARYVTINAGDGNDSVYNNSWNAVIDTGAGNDSIHNESASLTVDAGAGNDTVLSYGYYSSLNGGAGNDYITNYGDSVTIDGGLGNDTLIGHGNGDEHSGVDIFQYSGGDDVVVNYSAEDTIQIKNGRVNSYSFDGGDLILNLTGGTMRLKNMTNHYITVSDSTGTSTRLYSNGTTQQSVMKSLIRSLKDNTSVTNYTTALDRAIQSVTEYFTGIQNALNRFKSDFNSSGGGDKFLRDYCGIILDNEDTGAITGWDAGGSTVKTAESIVPEYSSTVYQPYGNSFTTSGLTLTYSSNLTSIQQNIVNGLYTWWIDSSIDLIRESYGVSFDSNPQSIPLNIYTDADSSTMAAVGYYTKSGTRLVDLNYIMINTAHYPITSLDQNGTTPTGQEYLDRTIAHELTHAVQDVTFGQLPEFFTEGLAELTHGVDDTRELMEVANSSTRLQNAVNNALTYNKAYDNYPVGYMFWRYLTKQIADNYSWSYGQIASKNSGTSSSKSSSSTTTTDKKSRQLLENTDYNSSLWGGMSSNSSNSTLNSAVSSLNDNLTVRDNLSSIDLGLSVDDISRQFSTDTGLILADNSNSSLNMFDTSNITFGIQQKKNLI